MKRCIYTGFFLFLLFGLSSQEISTSRFSNLAIRGYDPVAYHTLGRAEKGRSEFSLEWKGADWRFVSAEHRDLFRDDPERYAPRFGGHCANGLSDGHKVNGDPRQWRIIDGELFLFYSAAGRASWEGNVGDKLRRAEATWERLR